MHQLNVATHNVVRPCSPKSALLGGIQTRILRMRDKGLINVPTFSKVTHHFTNVVVVGLISVDAAMVFGHAIIDITIAVVVVVVDCFDLQHEM